jgi:hypothetical protein
LPKERLLYASTSKVDSYPECLMSEFRVCWAEGVPGSLRLQNTNAPLELRFRALIDEDGAYRVEAVGGLKR